MKYLVEYSDAPSTGSVVTDLAVVFILVLANAFFVASEFALVSVRKTRIDQLAAEGNSAAAVVQRAVRDLDRYIAATQVGITLASLLLGGLGERALEPLLSFLFVWMPEKWLGHNAYRPGSEFCVFHYDSVACHYWRVDAKIHCTPKAGYYCTLDWSSHVILCHDLFPIDVAVEWRR